MTCNLLPIQLLYFRLHSEVSKELPEVTLEPIDIADWNPIRRVGHLFFELGGFYCGQPSGPLWKRERQNEAQAYSAILCSRADSLRSCRCDCKWVTVTFHSTFWILTEVVYLQHLQRCSVVTCWCHMKLLPSRRILCTLYNHAPCHVTSWKTTYIGCIRV